VASEPDQSRERPRRSAHQDRDCDDRGTSMIAFVAFTTQTAVTDPQSNH
jgi:hypothetical protein